MLNTVGAHSLAGVVEILGGLVGRSGRALASQAMLKNVHFLVRTFGNYCRASIRRVTRSAVGFRISVLAQDSLETICWTLADHLEGGCKPARDWGPMAELSLGRCSEASYCSLPSNTVTSVLR